MRRLVLPALVLLVLPAAARAGGPGGWSRITARNGSNTDQVGLVRRGASLQVAWVRKSSEVSYGLEVRTIRANGTPFAADTDVTSSWRSMTGPDVIRATGTAARIFFAGQRLGVSGEEHENLSSAFSPSAGAPYSLESGDRATGNSVYQSDIGVGRSLTGAPVEAWSSTFGVNVHAGLVPGPVPNPNVQSLLGRGCCGHEPDVATDGASGAMYAAWYSNATAHQGVYTVRVSPLTAAPTGTVTRMPGSATRYAGRLESSFRSGRTPIAGRPGRGGVFVAYPGGYPTTTKALLWRVGAVRPFVAGRSTDGVRDVGVAADPNGRVWVFWHVRRGGTPRLLARRSNLAATRLGATVSSAVPPRATQTWGLVGDAQRGRLDVLGHYSTPGSTAYWSSQVLPGLTVAADHPVLRRGAHTAETFHVTDAGDPRAGVRVSAAGHSGVTSASGHVTLHLGPFPASVHGVAVAAAHGGYTTAAPTLPVRQ